MISRTSTPAAIALTLAILAGCGGGGSESAVSASPSAPESPPAGTPAAEPPAGEPPAGEPPAAEPPAGEPPVAEPPATDPPAAATVPAPNILSHLAAGVSADPARAGSPVSTARILHDINGGPATIELAASASGNRPVNMMHSYVVASGFPTGTGLGLADSAFVSPVIGNGTILSVEANGLTYQGPALNLGSGDLPLDRRVGEWRNGEYSVSLVLTSVGERSDLMRVCWDVYLPPPEPISGPPGYEVPPHLVRTAPFERLMCGIYARDHTSADVGGYVIDLDQGGVRTTYQGYW